MKINVYMLVSTYRLTHIGKFLMWVYQFRLLIKIQFTNHLIYVVNLIYTKDHTGENILMVRTIFSLPIIIVFAVLSLKKGSFTERHSTAPLQNGFCCRTPFCKIPFFRE